MNKVWSLHDCTLFSKSSHPLLLRMDARIDEWIGCLSVLLSGDKIELRCRSTRNTQYGEAIVWWLVYLALALIEYRTPHFNWLASGAPSNQLPVNGDVCSLVSVPPKWSMLIVKDVVACATKFFCHGLLHQCIMTHSHCLDTLDWCATKQPYWLASRAHSAHPSTGFEQTRMIHLLMMRALVVLTL